MSGASSSFALFASLLLLVNGEQFLNNTFLFPLPGAASVPVFVIIIVQLTSIYAPLWSHKHDLIVEV